MRKWVAAAAVLLLAVAGTTAGVLALNGGGDDGPETGSLPPVDSSSPAEDADCDLVEGVAGCDDGLDPSDCDPAPLRSDCGIDPDECNEVHNIRACETDGATSSPVCAPDVPDCEEMIVNGTCLEGTECDVEGGPALPPPDDPNGASGPGEYQLRISFNETVQQDHLDETGARIAELAPGAEYVIQESFPPTGVANFAADTEDVCLALTQELEQTSFVASVSCGPWLPPGDVDPDEPVTDVAP